MPLQDHFNPPLSQRRHWHSFHNSWATFITSALNQQLPPQYFAEPNVQFGIQIDVAAFEEADSEAESQKPAAPVWVPPEPSITVPIALAEDIVQIEIYHTEGGPELVGAIELVSPANKDRPEHRDAFVSKCASYVQVGIGLLIVDIVTDRRSNLHKQLLERLGTAAAGLPENNLYAASYRPLTEDSQERLAIWYQSLTVGRVLPTLPLWLRCGPCLRLDLEATYERTCMEHRISTNGAQPRDPG